MTDDVDTQCLYCGQAPTDIPVEVERESPW